MPVALAASRDRRRRPTCWPACSPESARSATPTGRSGVNLALGDLLEGSPGRWRWRSSPRSSIVFVRGLVGIRADRASARAWRGMGDRFWRVVGAQLLATLGVAAAGPDHRRHPLRALEAGRLGLRPAGGPVHRQVDPRFPPRQLRPRPRSLVARGRGSSYSSPCSASWSGRCSTFALIFTSLPLLAINLLGALIFALLIPYVALGETLLYFDLRARAEAEPAKPRRSWRPWRPRQVRPRRRDSGPRPAASG